MHSSSDDDSEDMNMLGGRDGVIVGGAEEKAEHIADQWEFHDFDQEDWSDIREEYSTVTSARALRATRSSRAIRISNST